MSIQDDVIKLYKAGAKRIVLDEIKPRPAIAAAVGVGAVSAAVKTASTSTVRKEVITVYSHLIITGDGAFERPIGWPIDGAYPPGTVMPSPLPDSIVDGKLDIDVQHYEQKRVHLVVYQNGDYLEEDWFLVPLAMPFEGGGTYQGIGQLTASLWSAPLYMTVAPVPLTSKAAARRDEFLSLSIING